MKFVCQTMENFVSLSREKDVILFGSGEYCMRFLNNIPPEATKNIALIVDNNPEKHGVKLFGINVASPEVLKSKNVNNTIVVITIENGIPEIYKQILYFGNFTIMAARILLNNIFSTIAKELYEGQDQINKVKELLFDEKSKWIYEEAIRRRMLFGECDFSDLVIKGDAEYRVPFQFSNNFPKDEIILDCGAYTGDSLRKFVETFGYSLSKIYVFECMQESLQELEKSIQYIKNRTYSPDVYLMPYALSDKEGTMRFAKVIKKVAGSFLIENRPFAQKALFETEYTEVKATSIDKAISIDEKVTLIKMDIEGSESAALRGAQHIIQTHKPKLAISIYHSGTDYYKIPLYVKSLVPEYKIAVRHHNRNHCDTDMYCWV